ncbi:MAG TPA: cytochrome c maturation protein CcmE, partial [Sphingomonadaceae bacterium]|nr:cytochrome c maturation protein CcmE [Sphingomonadaceae bacterium]
MKAKHQRLVLVLLALAALIGAALLAMSALRDQAAYFYTPGDVVKDALPVGRAVRLGGMVKAHSIVRDPDGVT